MKEVEKRRLQVAVAGIPKTIDNDIAVSLCVYFVGKNNAHDKQIGLYF